MRLKGIGKYPHVTVKRVSGKAMAKRSPPVNRTVDPGAEVEGEGGGGAPHGVLVDFGAVAVGDIKDRWIEVTNVSPVSITTIHVKDTHGTMTTSFSFFLGTCHLHHHPPPFHQPLRSSLRLFRARRYTPAPYYLQGEDVLLPYPCHLSPFHWVFLSEGTRGTGSSDCQVYGEANRCVLILTVTLRHAMVERLKCWSHE